MSEDTAAYSGKGMSGRIVAFSGTHGTGKTTAVYTRAALLKRSYPRAEVGIICEVARRCPLPIVSRGRAEVDADAQRWIFAAQVAEEIAAAARHDLVVADRTVVDCIAYTRAGGLDGLARAMMAMAARHVRIYREIHFRRAEAYPCCADDGLRNMDEDFRARVEREMIEIYHAMGVELL